MIKANNKGQAQLFKNKYLEMLTKTHPLVIWGLYIPIIGYMLYYSKTSLNFSSLSIITLFILSMFSWTLFEYLAHRYIFHWVSKKNFLKKVTYTLHGNHHEYPRDRQRLFMPPLPSIIISSIIFAVFYLIAGNYAFIWFPGFILGYLMYASMHYAIHAFPPPFKWMKPLWRNHHLHHYKDEEKGFGVSSLLWDWIFNTRFDLKKEKEDKEKVKELLFDNNKYQ
ncbi:sterol desaturase family protein [Olivibacter domesticus]|uniref:Sterol desaturase/sphingolipid hydroxylase, fatty acid hydroxylase superfamily n=1 Tax=Olivibacter domesticus TaxID=407022 RepID=A0A1H7ML51_OLID1|nr:sterol desaturase family protein [Olivibacter domesticus]SEL11932.1 Sterol desaturase/sphingolipid hydroxylase, fatty acid hydroxylase superfamily [Olivibacter domesticus]